MSTNHSDRYDGEESAIQTHTQVKVEDPNEEQNQYVAPKSEPEIDKAMIDAQDDPSNPITDHNYNTEPIVDEDQGWQNAENTHSNGPIDGPDEGDSHGIGIKEDG